MCLSDLRLARLLQEDCRQTRAVQASWNVMKRAQEPCIVFRRNGRVHFNRRGRQFSRLLAAEVCASAVVMLHKLCCEVVWRVLAIHSIRQFPIHFPSLRHRVQSHFNWSLLLLVRSYCKTNFCQKNEQHIEEWEDKIVEGKNECWRKRKWR